MIVQKFGGIAMKDKESRQICIHHIKEGLAKYKSVIVVVSAMGRLGDPYSTDTLIQLTDAFQLAPESKDVAAICGELLSSSVLYAECLKEQIPCQLAYGVQAGIYTDDRFGDATIIKTSTKAIEELLQHIPCVIVPGFQGITTDHRFTTLGRGGSDLTAILLASLFKANAVEFYKDVPGVMSSDPRSSTNVQKLSHVSYQKLQHLCETAKHPLIQKKAVDMAAKHHVPLHIRPFGSSEEGTWINSTIH
ncbi:MAG: aspartate kinase [Paenisporosarcina sp.]